MIAFQNLILWPIYSSIQKISLKEPSYTLCTFKGIALEILIWSLIGPLPKAMKARRAFSILKNQLKELPLP